MRHAFVALFCLVLVPVTARAQGTRVDVGTHVAVSGVLRDETTAGAGILVDVNIAPSLAVEGRANFFSSPVQSGPVHLAAGVKATLVRTRQLAIYGIALPGLYRASNYRATFDPDADPDGLVGASVAITGRSPRFALQMGAGLTMPVSARFGVRAEFTRLIYALSPLEVVSGTDRYEQPSPLSNGWDMQIGVTYRAGARLGAPTEIPVRGRWTAGLQAGYTVVSGPAAGGTVGLFASYRLSRYCDFDASVSTFVTSEIQPNSFEGGGIAQGVAGFKLGVRTGRVSVFFKARAGVHSYSDGFNYDPGANTFFARVTVPALDIGGVVEATMTPRLVLRFDLGETLSFFRDIDVRQRTGSLHVDGATFYTVPLRAGVGWRF